MCQTFIKGPRGLAPARATDPGYPRDGFGPCGPVNAEIWGIGALIFQISGSL